MRGGLPEDTAAMPRVNIYVQDIEDAEELEAQEQWERQLGLEQELRPAQRGNPNGRGPRRLGGAESMDRKYSERRKQVYRGGKR